MKAAPLSTRDYKQLSSLLTKWTGINLHAKQHLMLGRLQPRLRALRLTSFHQYLLLLEEGGRSGPEAQQFINALTTNKTSFFRESHHFDFLAQRVFAEARARADKTGRKSLRLWSAGCSRGAEPYTMAMLVADQLPTAQGWDVHILATDLDTEVLADAERGIYDEAEIAQVPEGMRKRHFTRVAQGFKMQRAVAALVSFAQVNLVAEPFPIRGRFDVIFCRNVLIYFDRPTQQRIVRKLVSCLAPTGYLVIGHSESMAASHLPRLRETVGVYRPAAVSAISVQEQAPAPAQPPRAVPPKAACQRGGHARGTAAKARPGAPVEGLMLKRIVLGEWFATRDPLLIATLLGSCVSACLYDPVARVGGMNHFMLPKVTSQEGNCARFGVHAMEVLINALMQLGADRSRLRAMAFGAGAVNRALSARVSSQNGEFVRRFLAAERIPLVYERLGGNEPREVFMRADTGEAFVRRVQPQSIALLQTRELAAYRKPAPQTDAFDPDAALF